MNYSNHWIVFKGQTGLRLRFLMNFIIPPL